MEAETVHMSTVFENYQNGGTLPVPVDLIQEVPQPDLSKRMVSLSTVAIGGEEYAKTFKTMADLGLTLSETSEYVSMSATLMDDSVVSKVESDCGCEKTFYDDETLKKVYRAIKDILHHDQLDAHQVANDILVNLQNHGILFRERI